MKFVIKDISGKVLFKSIVKYFNVTLALEAGIEHRNKYFPPTTIVDATY